MNFVLSVVNALQPFVGYIVSALVAILIFCIAKWGGTIIVKVETGHVDKLAGLGISFFWANEKGFLIGFLNQQVKVSVMQGEFLIIDQSQIVRPIKVEQAPVPVAAVKPMAVVTTPTPAAAVDAVPAENTAATPNP